MAKGDRTVGMGVLQRSAIDEVHIKTPSSTAQFPQGLEVDIRDAANTNTVKTYLYIKSHGALSSYVPFQVDHTGGNTGLITKAATEGAARIAIKGAPTGTWADAYFGFIQVKGDATCRIGQQTTYVIGDHIKSVATLNNALVDGTSGSTSQSVKTFAVIRGAQSNGSSVKEIGIYMFGDKADVQANS